MNLVELDRALRQLRLSGMAAVLETRLRQAQTEKLTPIDLVSTLVVRRAPASAGPAARAPAQAGALSRSRSLARHLRFRFQQEDESRADLRARHRPLHRAARGRALSRAARDREEPSRRKPSAAPRSSRATASSIAKRTRSSRNSPTPRSTARARTISPISPTVPLLIIDDLGMRKLPHTAAEDLLEIIMRRYERASTLLTSNRPVDDWGKLLGDTAAVTALLDRLLHHAHVLKCGPRSWRTKVQTDLRTEEATK